MNQSSTERERRTELMHLRIEPSLNQRLKAAAKRQNTPYSEFVRQLCREGLARLTATDPAPRPPLRKNQRVL